MSTTHNTNKILESSISKKFHPSLGQVPISILKSEFLMEDNTNQYRPDLKVDPYQMHDKAKGLLRGKYFILGVLIFCVSIFSISLVSAEFVGGVHEKPSKWLARLNGSEIEAKSGLESANLNEKDLIKNRVVGQDLNQIKPITPVSQVSSIKKVATAKPKDLSSQGSSLNVRSSPCDTIVSAQTWGSQGEIIDGPIQKECLGANYSWYKIRWSDDTIGWSVSDYLVIS